MKKRGPKSTEDEHGLNVIEGNFGHKRPAPPERLTTRQQEIWRETTLSEPETFFNTSALQTLLSAFCCHASEIERMTQTINDFQTAWIKNREGMKIYSDLVKLRAKETTAMCNAARSLRLTNQSRYTPMAAATASRNTMKGIMPWEE